MAFESALEENEIYGRAVFFLIRCETFKHITSPYFDYCIVLDLYQIQIIGYTTKKNEVANEFG